MRRVPSPGTASSTGGSDDDQGDSYAHYKTTIQGRNGGGIPEYQGASTTRIEHPQNMRGLPMIEGQVGGENGRGLTDCRSEVASYLNYLNQSSCDLPSPSISNPTTPIYPFQPSSHSPGYSNYSYFPLDAGQPHPPRPRSPTSRTLHARFTQFWGHMNPFGLVCPNSPKFASVVHAIFTHYVPLYAEEDDMVNHALMAFSAADAGINAGDERGRKLNIAGWKHAGRCQRMLGVRLGRLNLGSMAQRGDVDGLVSESEITAVRLGIFLMLCYGLCISDASLLRLTSELLTLSKTKPGHPTSASSPATVPITSTYTDLGDGGYRVRLSLDHNPGSEEPEEVGLIVGDTTHIFTQIRKEYESHLAPEILWEGLNEDEDDDDGEEEEEEEVDDDTSGVGSIARIGSEERLRKVRLSKQQPEILRINTAPPTHRIPTAHPGLTPTSAAALTPNIPVVNFPELSSVPYPHRHPAGPYSMDLSVNHNSQPLLHPHTHHLTQLAGPSTNPSVPQYVSETLSYTRAPPHLYPSGPIGSYPATGTLPPPVTLPQIPADTGDIIHRGHQTFSETSTLDQGHIDSSGIYSGRSR